MWIWISMACAALSLYLLAWWLGRPYAVANESLARPKRMALSLMWPWVDAVAHACGPFMTWRQRRHLQQLLQRAGAHAPWSPQHLCALQIILGAMAGGLRSEEHTSELQSRPHLVCRLLLEKKRN